MIGQALHVHAGLECAICHGYIDEDQKADDIIEAALFGTVPYAQCPGCLQFVGDVLMRDYWYRRRARVRVYERTGRVWPTTTELDSLPPEKSPGWRNYASRGGKKAKANSDGKSRKQRKTERRREAEVFVEYD